MELPIDVKNYIESSFINENINEVKKSVQPLIDLYLSNTGNIIKINDEITAKTYALFMMPATYAAVSEAIKHILEIYKCKISSVNDFGMGTGSSSLACYYNFPLKEINCYEYNPYMMKVGEKILDQYIDIPKHYHNLDITKEDILAKSDLSIASFMLNELKDEDIEQVVDKLWLMTNKVLLIVEAGTPRGFSIIKKVRDNLINKGGYIIAPCPHAKECLLSNDDWCHFSIRVARSKIHKYLKQADVPYEDKKYCYIAFSKEKIDISYSRILRHPIISKGYIKLKICDNSSIKEVTYSKKDKDLYKLAKKKKWGDII